MSLIDELWDFVEALKQEGHRKLTRDDVLDRLFSRRRDDPEAKYLERKMRHTIDRLLREPQFPRRR